MSAQHRFILFAVVSVFLAGCHKPSAAQRMPEPVKNVPEAAKADAVRDAPAAGKADAVNESSAAGEIAADAVPSADTEKKLAVPAGELCGDDFCKCGEITCGRGFYCDGGKCRCGDISVDENIHSFKCSDEKWICAPMGGANSCIAAGLNIPVGAEFDVKTKKFSCGGIQAGDDVLASPSMWRCDAGLWKCWAGAADHSDGCKCGTSLCGWKTTCTDGKCMCGDVVFVQDAKTYVCEDGRVVCADYDGCACGNTVCGSGGACSGGKCTCGGKPWKFKPGFICENGKPVRSE